MFFYCRAMAILAFRTILTIAQGSLPRDLSTCSHSSLKYFIQTFPRKARGGGGACTNHNLFLYRAHGVNHPHHKIMETESLLEESIPWEVRLLKEYCNSTVDLDTVSKIDCHEKNPPMVLLS